MEYIATFFSHFGALNFARQLGKSAQLMPVPRFLSSSCGTCVRFCQEQLQLPPVLDELDAVYLTDETPPRVVYRHPH
ncbi:MAG: DUF3343 domain-containing protein [Eubacteriales bacterium]|jgi:hypothetical protein